MKIENYLTTKEVAERLSVSVSRVKKLVTLGRLNPIKLGKVNLYELEEVNNFTRLEVGRPPKAKNKNKGK